MSTLEKKNIIRDCGDGRSEAEVTLRLIASLPAPQGLENRVHDGLRAARASKKKTRVLSWPARPRLESNCATQRRRPLCLWWSVADGAFIPACSRSSRPT